MPLYDYQCERCGHIEEVVKTVDDRIGTCSDCGGATRRIVSVGSVEANNDDAAWIRSITDVVDKESKAPHVVEFLRNPTRTNYKNWMRKEGIRHMEPGEKPINRKEFDVSRHADKVMEAYRERSRINI